MRIEVNGSERDILPHTHLTTLLSDLQIEPRMVAIELNRTVVDRKQFDQIALKEGDQIEIINFVGGG
jgi:sulfur carrier protein